MGTDDAKQIYKQRAATAETVNADAEPIAAWLPPRCVASTRASAPRVSFALTYNILRFITVSA